MWRWAKLTGMVVVVMGLLCGNASAGGYPSTTTGWAAMMKALPIFGDGMVSCDLGGGRRAFVTGDATPRDGSAWAHSSITVVSGQTAHVVKPNYPNTPSPYQVIPGEGQTTKDWHWLGPCAAAPGISGAGKLLVLAPHVAQSTEWPYFTSVGHDLAEFTYTPKGDPVFSRFIRMPVTAGVSWSAGLAVAGGLLYAFGSSDGATDGWTGHDVYMTRSALVRGIPVTSWSTPKLVLSAPRDGGVETSFSVAHDAKGWHLTSKLGGVWGPGEVSEWSTPALTGAVWSRRTLVTGLPNDSYIPWKHYGLKLADGTVPLTYNTPGNDATWVGVPG